jgi:hypothetical protein
LLRANHVAVTVLIAAIIVAAVVAIGSDRRGADRSPVDASANRSARYRAAIIAAASRNRVSTTGNAITAAADADRSATDPYGASMKASATPVATATAAACGCFIRHQAGADQNDCCQCSESNSKHGISPVLLGPNMAGPQRSASRHSLSAMRKGRLDLDQRSDRFGDHDDRQVDVSVPRESCTGQRAFDEAASLQPLLNEGEAVSSGAPATFHS